MTPMQLLSNERIIHSLKTGLAVLFGFLITKSTHLPVDQWLIITIIVVMCAQINVGSMIQKSIMRFFGTLAGSLIGMLTMFFLGNSPLTHAVIITLATMYFSYLSTGQSRLSDAGTLGAATTVIILINPNPSLLLGLHRTIEILLGILIAALVSQFILPIHARTYLRRDQVDTFKKLRALYFENFLSKSKDKSANDHFVLDEQLIKSLITQRKLALDAAREPFAKKSFVVRRFSDLLACEREILRSVDFMHHAFTATAESQKIFSSEHVLHDFHERICAAFDAIADYIKSNRKKALIIDIPNVQPLRDVIHEDKLNLTEEDVTCTGAFLFCAEVLVSRMKELVELIKK